MGFSLLMILTSIIDWYYPDAIVQIEFIKNTNFFGAIYGNWAHTSIGRPGGVFWIDLWFSILLLFNSLNVYSLFFYKTVTFFITGLSFFFILNTLNKDNSLLNFYYSVIFFNIFLIVTGQFNLTFIFEMDLSIYIMSVAYFNFLIIFLTLMLKYNFKKRYTIVFGIFFLLYNNSSYAHLITGGLILFFSFFSISDVKFYIFRPKKFIDNFFILKNITPIEKRRNKHFNLFIFLYLVSVIINLMSPSMSIREQIWPSDSSLFLGLISSIPLLEFLIISSWGYKYLFISLLVYLIFKMCNIEVKVSNTLILLFILSTPIIVIASNSLAFLASNLHQSWDSIISNRTLFSENLLKYTNNYHASAARHFVYYNLNALTSYIFLGIFFAKIKFK